MNIYKGYIQSDGKGKTYGSWIDDNNLSDNFSNDWSCFCAVLTDGVVLLDFDDEESFDKAYAIIKKKGYKPKLNHNNHHMLFKKPIGYRYDKRLIRQLLVCGIECDVLVNSLECVKKDGALRFDGINNSVDELDELPCCFYPLKFSPTSTWNSYDFNALNIDDGEGRYALLYGLRLALTQKGFTEFQIVEVLEIINTIVFNSPISANNWERITDFKAIQQNEYLNYTLVEDTKNGKKLTFLPYTFVVDQLEKMHVTKHNGTAYGFVNDAWYEVYDYMDTLITKLFKDKEKPQYSQMVKRQLNALISYNLLLDDNIQWNNPRYTTFKNGTYDWETNRLIPTDWSQYQTIKIPFEYDDKVESDIYDTIMYRCFGEDEEQKRAVLEVIGSGFYKDNRVKKKFTIFYGKGDNAKSLFTDAIVKICGHELVSGASITELNTDKFATATTYNKLFNIVDDANADYSGDTGRLKSICTGQAIKIEQKGKDAFYPDEPPFCTILLNSNKLIRIGNGEDAHAIRKRRNLVYFTRQFKPTDEDFDPDACITALADTKFLQKLLYESMQAFRNMLHRSPREFTIPTTTKVIYEQFDDLMVQAQNVITDYAPDEWCRFNLYETYEFYKQVCGTTKPKNMITVKNMILEQYPQLNYNDKYKAFYGDEPLEDMNYLLVRDVFYPSYYSKSDILKDLKFKFKLNVVQSRKGGYKSQRLKLACTSDVQ